MNEHTEVTLSYTNDEGDLIEWTRTLTLGTLGAIIEMMDMEALDEEE